MFIYSSVCICFNSVAILLANVQAQLGDETFTHACLRYIIIILLLLLYLVGLDECDNTCIITTALNYPQHMRHVVSITMDFN